MDVADLTLDELRLALAPGIADSAVFDGWSVEALDMAADQLGADTIVSDADDQSFASKNNESPPPPRLAQPRAAAALTEEA